MPSCIATIFFRSWILKCLLVMRRYISEVEVEMPICNATVFFWSWNVYLYATVFSKVKVEIPTCYEMVLLRIEVELHTCNATRASSLVNCKWTYVMICMVLFIMRCVPEDCKLKGRWNKMYQMIICPLSYKLNIWPPLPSVILHWEVEVKVL